LFFSKRLIEPEFLDHLPAEEARPNLADLTRINRLFGGHSVIRKALRRAVDGSQRFSLIDVGCASGDGARMVARRYSFASVTCLDYNGINMENAPFPKLLADAFRLPFAHSTFHIVLSSMLLHHFADEQVVRLLGELYRVAQKFLIICDLERHVLPYIFLPATQPIFGWNRITVQDGMKSVRASFRADELRRLAIEAGIASPEIEVHRPAFRISLVARK
jgi:2-polyprenyl-3-methyl-5-hydroxy-6-metoxy-1,4-benzoquinol methylase